MARAKGRLCEDPCPDIGRLYQLLLPSAVHYELKSRPLHFDSPLSKISSVPGGNSLLFKDVVCLGTSPSLDPLSKISSVPNGARASVICFHSVVFITFASHAKGPQFETGWKQSLV